LNVLFLSLGEFDDLSQGSVHIDIMKQFAKEHSVYLVCKRERRTEKPTELTEEFGLHVLRVRTGNIKNTNIIEKGLSTVMIEPQFVAAVKKYFREVKFDLVLYTTPPITFADVVKYVKKRDGARSYLMLKDIFPQNSVDIGMISKNGPKGLIYRFFRAKEKELYRLSDHIGCMSKANVQYIITNNPEVDSSVVEECPNMIAAVDMSVDMATRVSVRQKYGIPIDKTVFVYGGNLGKPQGIPFLIRCLSKVNNYQSKHPVDILNKAYILIVGGGTEYGVLEAFMREQQPANMKLISSLPREDYNAMVGSCDVGLIFLDHRFTIPNFPSRMLSYMQAKMPILAVTDPNTDVGEVIVNGRFGWWCESNSTKAVVTSIRDICKEAVEDGVYKMGVNGWNYVNEYYSPDVGYQTIMKHM